MGSNRYVRLNLTATQNHIPDPAIEVEVWLDRLEELLACWGPKPDPLDCYDLLALWARLQRTRPDLLAQLEGNQELAGAETLLAERDPELARLALTVPDPPTWREETRALEASYEELIDPVERSTLAENLLTDLDDAELVLHSARRHGVDDPQLDKELQVCRTWLMRHADLFLAASVFVQAVGMTFRPELADEDYDLALTALKYERILDAAEEAEAELAFVGLTPFHPSVIKALAQQYQQKAEKSTLVPAAAPEPGPRILEVYRQALESPFALAAKPEPAPQLNIVRWDSPDRRWVAHLPIPEHSQETWLLRFYTADGDAGRALAGQVVRLDGVEARIDGEGRATFSRHDLEQAAQRDLRLEVGSDRTIWKRAVD